MFCNSKSKKLINRLALLVGIVTFLYGLLSFLFAPEGTAGLDKLRGMFTGFGAGIIGVAVVRTLREKMVSPEKLEKEDIVRNDERNVQIRHAAGTAALLASTLVFAVLIFLFEGMGYSTPSMICLVAMYVPLIVFLIARVIISRKM